MNKGLDEIDHQTLTHRLAGYAAVQLPRVLTQMDRDPDSPTAGCFDRNYWHYKIRDFPSSILQQGVHVVEALRKGGVAPWTGGATANNWSVAAVNALARQVDRVGGVDEYYPFERSYPAAAFGLYAATRVLLDWQDQAPLLLDRIDWPRLRRLAHHVSGRIERQAANQQAAGLAGMAMGSRLPLLELPVDLVRRHADRVFAAQHEEGWWDEYGGPDFGYLTVTLDALADYFDATADARAQAATDRAVAFLASLVGVDGRLPSTLNSRNTDYVVPYGLARAGTRNGQAAWLVRTLFAGVNDPRHFLWATDDRYHCHYVYSSVLRALPYLPALTASQAPAHQVQTWMPGCGYWIHRPVHGRWTAYVGANKGGLIRVHRIDGPPVADFGWRVKTKHQLMTTNWWSNQWQVDFAGDRLQVTGRCQVAGFPVSKPARHVVLRLLSFFLHDRLIPMLKRIMIFRPNRQRGPRFDRQVRIDDRGLHVRDEFAPMPGAILYPGPRQNLRHVASADSFCAEELDRPLLPDPPMSLDAPRIVQASWPDPTPSPQLADEQGKGKPAASSLA